MRTEDTERPSLFLSSRSNNGSAYQSVALVLKPLEDAFGAHVLAAIISDGIPKDIESAVALAHRKDNAVEPDGWFKFWRVETPGRAPSRSPRMV